MQCETLRSRCPGPESKFAQSQMVDARGGSELRLPVWNRGLRELPEYFGQVR